MTTPEYLPRPPRMDIHNPTFVYVENKTSAPLSWGQWNRDCWNHGTTHAYQTLISSLIIEIVKLTFTLIDEGLFKPSQQIEPPQDNTIAIQDQQIKIDILGENCSALLDTQGKIQLNVLRILAQSQNELLYPTYLLNVSKCLEPSKAKH